MSDEHYSCDSNFELFEGKEWNLLNILHIFFELLIASIAIIGNFLVFIVFLREQRLRRDINYYIISLVIGDFCVGIVSIPIYVISADHPYTKHLCNLPICLTKMSILITISNISVFSLILISIKRLKIMSMRVPKSQSEPKLLIIMEIGICWIIALGIGTVPLYFYNENSTTCYLHDILRSEYIIPRFIIVVVVPLIIIGLVHFKIYKWIFKKAQMRNDQNNTSIKTIRMQTNQKRIDKEIRATISISIIVLVFCITWLPLQVLYLLSVFCKDCVQVHIVNFAISFLHLNSAINPLIYACRMRDIRRAIYRIFGIKSLSRNTSST